MKLFAKLTLNYMNVAVTFTQYNMNTARIIFPNI